MTDYTATDSIKQHSHGVEIFVSICLKMNSALNAPLQLSAKIVAKKKGFTRVSLGCLNCSTFSLSFHKRKQK